MRLNDSGNDGDECVSFVGQRQSTRQPSKEVCAEKLLKGFHLMTDGRLTDT